MSDSRVLKRREGHVFVMGLNRPEKRNAFDLAMLRELAAAYGELDADPELRVGVLYAEGPHFTAGLDLAEVAPEIARGFDFVPEGGIDPWQTRGQQVSKPLIVAVHGRVLTLGIELVLAADIVVAAESATFAQIEIARGIFPFGGATVRFPQRAGWGDAMRWLLTADEFGVSDAERMGLVQEVTRDGGQLERALELARRIAAQAPLGVQATLRSARLALREGPAAAEAELGPEIRKLMATEDARLGVEAFLSRTPAKFVGR